MNLSAQSFSHLPTSHIGNGMQGQAVVELVVIEQILADAIDDEMKQLMLFVQEQGDCQVSDLFFRVFVGRDEVDCFQVPKVHGVSQDVDVQQLRDSSALLDMTKIPTLQTYFFL